MSALSNIYFSFLLLITALGTYRFSMFELPDRLFFFLIATGLINEIIVRIFHYRQIDTMILYHFYCPVDFILVTLFFLYSINIRQKVPSIVTVLVLIPMLGYLNYKYLQPVNHIASNMFTLESFSAIIMALFALYKILVDDRIDLLYKYANFWFWAFSLILYGGTFFFWAYIIVIAKDDHFIEIAQNIQGLINIFVLIGIGLVFLFYPKMAKQ